MSGRRWTEVEDRAILNQRGKMNKWALAKALGRTPNAVLQRAARLGASVKMPYFDDGFNERLRVMHAEGKHDNEVAEALGVARCTVVGLRRKLGLKSNRHNADHLAKMRKQFKTQLVRAGVKSLAALREVTRSLRIFQSGWPAGLNTIHAKVLDALETGAKTREQLCKRLGIKFTKCHAMTRGQRSVLMELVRMGYVKWQPTPARHIGPNAWERLYSIAITRRHVGQNEVAA